MFFKNNYCNFIFFCCSKPLMADRISKMRIAVGERTVTDIVEESCPPHDFYSIFAQFQFVTDPAT